MNQQVEVAPSKSGKIKGKVRHAQMNKARAQAYLTRATCIACKKVFRSPKKRLAHVQSGHISMAGWNEKRSAKGV